MLITREKLEEGNYCGNFLYYYSKRTQFLVGRHNKNAWEVAVKLSGKDDRMVKPQVFLVTGEIGLGKKHLVQWLMSKWLDSGYYQKIIYINDGYYEEGILNDLVASDALVITNLDRVDEKKFTLIETLVKIAVREGKMVIATMKDSLPESSEDIRNIFCYADDIWECRIDAPDYEFSVAILEHWVEENRHSVPMEVLQYLAANVRENFRILQGTLYKIIAMSILEKSPIDLEFAKWALDK